MAKSRKNKVLAPLSSIAIKRARNLKRSHGQDGGAVVAERRAGRSSKIGEFHGILLRAAQNNREFVHRYIFRVQGMQNALLKEVRRRLNCVCITHMNEATTGQSLFFFGHTKMVLHAFSQAVTGFKKLQNGNTELTSISESEASLTIKELSAALHGQIGIIFTTQDPVEFMQNLECVISEVKLNSHSLLSSKNTARNCHDFSIRVISHWNAATNTVSSLSP